MVRIRCVTEGTISKRRLVTKAQDPVAAQDGLRAALWDRICEGHRELIRWNEVDYHSSTTLKCVEYEAEPDLQPASSAQGQWHSEKEHERAINGSERDSSSTGFYDLEDLEVKRFDVEAQNGQKVECGVVQRRQGNILPTLVYALRVLFRGHWILYFLHSTQNERVESAGPQLRAFLKSKS